ncbi:MAG: hypothetical protein MUO70_00340 [Euryarchaeota archaeon]|nr:hypothetical protein [Euryarchaeota archaeon]
MLCIYRIGEPCSSIVMTLVDGQNVVKVGWLAEPGQYLQTDLLTYAITAERAGFDYFVGCSPAY